MGLGHSKDEVEQDDYEVDTESFYGGEPVPRYRRHHSRVS